MAKATGRFMGLQCEERVGTFAATWSIRAKSSRCLSDAKYLAIMGSTRMQLCGVHANGYRRHPGWRVEPIVEISNVT